MSMYPSLEDMEVDKLARAQAASQQHTVVQHQHGGVRRVAVVIEWATSRLHCRVPPPLPSLQLPRLAGCIPHLMTTWD